MDKQITKLFYLKLTSAKDEDGPKYCQQLNNRILEYIF